MGSSDRRVRFNVFSRAAVIAGGNRCVREQPKASREKATWAAPFWRVGWDFRAALRAKSGYASHLSESRSHSRTFYCVKFYQRLRLDHSN